MVDSPLDIYKSDTNEDNLKKLISAWRKRMWPLNVLFEVTSRCNLSCRHCYHHNGHDTTELNLSEIVDILDQLKKAGVLYLGITGGEPFTRSDILDILAAAKKRRFFVSLLSNGTLIDKPVAQSLGKLGIERIDLSFYGADAHTHDSITGVAGSFEAFYRGLSLLKSVGAKVKIKTTVLRRNYLNLENMKQFAETNKVPFMCDPKILPKINGDPSPLGERLDPSEYSDLLWESIWEVHDNSPETQRKVDSNNTLEDLQQDMSNREACKAGFASCSIRSSGVVSPCIVLPITLGDLRKESFENIWNGSKINDYRELSRGLYPECRICSLFSICFCCPAYAYLEEDDIMKAPEFSCRQAVYSEAFLCRRYMSKRRSSK